MNIIFKERIKELRSEQGLTQAQMAQKLGTTQRKISYWEAGKIEPDIYMLWKLSDFFGVTVDYLIGKTDY